MAVREYVGARYVPKFADPVEWQENTAYEGLTIVTYNNTSYTSKKPVPATVGTPKNNSEYWAKTGDYNAQVEQYRQDIAKAVDEVEDIKDDVQKVSDGFDSRVETALSDIADAKKDATDTIATDKKDATDTIAADKADALQAIEDATADITKGLETEKAERVAGDAALDVKITALKTEVGDNLQAKIADIESGYKAADAALEAKFDAVVKDVAKYCYNAVMDIGLDDGEDIADKLNAFLAEHDNCSVYFPPASYTISKTISAKRVVLIFDHTKITVSASIDTAIIIRPDSFQYADMPCGVNGLYLDGVNMCTNGIIISKCHAGYIKDTTVTRCTNGIYLGVTGDAFASCKVERCLLTKCNTGVYFNGNDCIISNTTCVDCKTGIDLTGGNECSRCNCWLTDDSLYDGSIGVNVRGNHNVIDTFSDDTLQTGIKLNSSYNIVSNIVSMTNTTIHPAALTSSDVVVSQSMNNPNIVTNIVATTKNYGLGYTGAKLRYSRDFTNAVMTGNSSVTGSYQGHIAAHLNDGTTLVYLDKVTMGSVTFTNGFYTCTQDTLLDLERSRTLIRRQITSITNGKTWIVIIEIPPTGSYPDDATETCYEISMSAST